MNRIFVKVAAIVGPAAVMTAGTMGAGTTSSLILAGAWFQYKLLWVAALVLPIFIISLDSASRIGIVNKEKGMFSLIREHIHPSVAWLILLINIPVHLFIAMAHMSIMTSAFLSLFGYYPPAVSGGLDSATYRLAEVIMAPIFAAAIIWLLTSKGYDRMQKLMTGCVFLMFICFLAVGIRGFQELGAIALGFIPSLPAEIPLPGREVVRDPTVSIIAIVGSVLAPAAMLGIPYMSADDDSRPADMRREFKKSLINLGFFYGGYSLLVIIAGGFALFPLANHAEIDSVHEASKILVRAFPDGFEFLGPVIFSVGMFVAAATTFIVVVEVISYFCLDMFGLRWHYTSDNRRFRRTTIVCILVPAILAPFWTFPALLKNLLLMGVNAIVIPLVFVVLLILANRRVVMREYTAGKVRNVILIGGLLLSVLLAVTKVPDFVRIFSTS